MELDLYEIALNQEVEWRVKRKVWITVAMLVINLNTEKEYPWREEQEASHGLCLVRGDLIEGERRM